MATFQNGDTVIDYAVHGDGFPVLAIAPGGMRSAAAAWAMAPWNPVEVLAAEYKVVTMDQRNAGASHAPVGGADGWHTYRDDQLALLDHLGIDRFHAIGMCIGGPYVMGLIAAAPERVVSGVLFQPIGLDDNRQAFYDMFDSWAEELKPERATPEADWQAFREAMYGGDAFLFNVDRAFVAACATPLLVLEGNDLYHPASTSRTIAELAPQASLVTGWKEEAGVAAGRDAVLSFLAGQTPAP